MPSRKKATKNSPEGLLFLIEYAKLSDERHKRNAEKEADNSFFQSNLQAECGKRCHKSVGSQSEGKHSADYNAVGDNRRNSGKPDLLASCGDKGRKKSSDSAKHHVEGIHTHRIEQVCQQTADGYAPYGILADEGKQSQRFADTKLHHTVAYRRKSKRASRIKSGNKGVCY